MCQFTDNFYAAVRCLAGDGPIKQRLQAAYIDHLEMLPEDEVPEGIRARFELLTQAMHSTRPLGGESPVAASVRKMSAAEAARHATAIVAMFSELVRVKATGERLRVVTPADAVAAEADPAPRRSALN